MAAFRALVVDAGMSVLPRCTSGALRELARLDSAQVPALMPSCTNSSTPRRWYEGRRSYSLPTNRYRVPASRNL